MERLMPGTRPYLVLLVAVISLCTNACGSDSTGRCLFNHMVGEIQVDPVRPYATGSVEAIVTVHVHLIGEDCKEPLEGATVEILSSRNTRDETKDIIQQPEELTDIDGRAVAHLGANCHGDAFITVKADGAFLCESWNNNQCNLLVKTVSFNTTCSGNRVICGECDCTDLDTDPENCGTCGNACEFPNAYGGCVDGKCQVGVCDEYWGDCNGEQSDGCEKSLLSDPENCGTCGHECYDELDFCQHGNCIHLDCDFDGDGYCIDDCDDYNSDIYPGAFDSCDGVDNNCDGQTDEDPDGVICDDNNECTVDVCVEGQGCVNVFIYDPCDDGNECTVDDSCREGLCVGDYLDEDQDGFPPIPCGSDCDDNDPTVNPNMFEGGCWDDLVCSDGKDNDCDGVTDREQPSCNLCAGDAYCDNGDACDGVERCINGCCASGTPVYCDDGDECTQNLCNRGSGECSYPPEADGTECDDGDECTVGDSCIAGVCRPGTPLDCDLGLACCSERCVDLSSNIFHCGQCDNPCDVGSGFMCRNGSCEHCEVVEYSVFPESWTDVEFWDLPECVSLYSEPERAWVVRDLECYQQLEISVSEEPDFSLYELVFVCDPFHGCEWDVNVLSVVGCDDYIALDYQVVAPCVVCDAEIPICKAVLIPNSQKPVHANAELVSETDCE